MARDVSIADIYRAFRAGANLRNEEVRRLLESRGHRISNNHLREAGRNSNRGGLVTDVQLYDLISAWADEEISKRKGAE